MENENNGEQSTGKDDGEEVDETEKDETEISSASKDGESSNAAEKTDVHEPQDVMANLELKLRQRMMSTGNVLSSPCDSPNNIRVKTRKRHSVFLSEEETVAIRDTGPNVLSDTNAAQDDVMDVLPHLLTPSSLEGYLRDAVGDYIRLDPSQYERRNGRDASSTFAASVNLSVQNSGDEGLLTTTDGKISKASKGSAEGEILKKGDEEKASGESNTNGDNEQADGEGMGKNVADIDDAYLEMERLRVVQKWGSATVVETYRRKMLSLQQQAQAAMKQGRVKEAEAIQNMEIEKLKTRGKAHNLLALSEQLSKKEMERDSSGRKRNNLRSNKKETQPPGAATNDAVKVSKGTKKDA